MELQEQLDRIQHDYQKLCEAFILVTEATKGTGGSDNRYADAEALLFKLYGHASSAFSLAQIPYEPGLRERLTKFKGEFTDFWSVELLGRATWESFLVFHYVFTQPVTQEEFEFRYYSWKLGGLLIRQNFPTNSQESIAISKQEKREIEMLSEALERNPSFQAMTNKQAKKLRAEGKWKNQSWREIAESAGINELHARHFYSYSSGYAHSDYLSVMQIRDAKDETIRKKMIIGTLEVILIAMAYMVNSYCKFFPNARRELQNHPDNSAIIDLWIAVGGSDKGNLGND